MIGTHILGLAALVSVGLAAAGCGGGGSPSANTAQNRAVDFSRCMRSHGVSKFPDPGRGGAIPKLGLEQLATSSSRLQAAEEACRHLLPNGGSPPSRLQQQRQVAVALRFAECVRSHGLLRFPDPGSDGRIADPATVGVDQGSPKFQAANQACRAYRPPYIPSNAAYDAWARTHRS